MKSLPVDDYTLARAVRLQEADNMTADSLVQLALDAYEILHERETGNVIGRNGAPSVAQWSRRFRAVQDGQHYVQVVPQPKAEGVRVPDNPTPRRLA